MMGYGFTKDQARRALAEGREWAESRFKSGSRWGAFLTGDAEAVWTVEASPEAAHALGSLMAGAASRRWDQLMEAQSG
jgi:hypothetical protein